MHRPPAGLGACPRRTNKSSARDTRAIPPEQPDLQRSARPGQSSRRRTSITVLTILRACSCESNLRTSTKVSPIASTSGSSSSRQATSRSRSSAFERACMPTFSDEQHAHAALGALANRRSGRCSATEPSLHPLPQPPAPRNREVATVHVGGDTSSHDHGPEGVGSRAGADHAGSSGHDRVVVLVAQPLASRACRSRLCSASLAPHHARPSQAHRNQYRRTCVGYILTMARSPNGCQALKTPYLPRSGTLLGPGVTAGYDASALTAAVRDVVAPGRARRRRTVGNDAAHLASDPTSASSHPHPGTVHEEPPSTAREQGSCE